MFPVQKTVRVYQHSVGTTHRPLVAIDFTDICISPFISHVNYNLYEFRSNFVLCYEKLGMTLERAKSSLSQWEFHHTQFYRVRNFPEFLLPIKQLDMATQNSREAPLSTETTSLNAFDSESSSFPENEVTFEQEQLDADNMDSDPTATQKKKKKKKPKKSAAAKAKDAAAKKAAETAEAECRPPVLCISRNKHWRYISSYHVRSGIILSGFYLSRIYRGLGFNFP